MNQTARKPKKVASEEMTPVENIIPTTRTAQGLRDSLFDELDKLRSGKSTPRQAVAVARVASEIIKSVNMEIELHNVSRSLRDTAKDVSGLAPMFVTGPLVLGTVE